MLNISSGVLGLNVPNFLPRSILTVDVDWLRPMGRLFWSSFLLVVMVAIATVWIKQPKRPNWPVLPVLGGLFVLWLLTAVIAGVVFGEGIIVGLVGLAALFVAAVFLALRFRPEATGEPATWAATVVGMLFVWIMLTLAYATIPHEWLIFSSSHLNWGKDTFFLTEDQLATNLPPIDIPKYVLGDIIATMMYVVFAVINVFMFSAWQKRKVVLPVALVEGGEEAPSTPAGPFARLRRRSRVSAYGRPVTTGE